MQPFLGAWKVFILYIWLQLYAAHPQDMLQVSGLMVLALAASAFSRRPLAPCTWVTWKRFSSALLQSQPEVADHPCDCFSNFSAC